MSTLVRIFRLAFIQTLQLPPGPAQHPKYPEFYHQNTRIPQIRSTAEGLLLWYRRQCFEVLQFHAQFAAHLWTLVAIGWKECRDLYSACFKASLAIILQHQPEFSRWIPLARQEMHLVSGALSNTSRLEAIAGWRPSLVSTKLGSPVWV